MISADAATQLAVFAVEALFVFGVLVGLFHIRHSFGWAPLYISLGTLQPLQTLFSTSVYVELGSGISVSPGSTVLFSATLFVILLIYIRDDAVEARKVVYGVALANTAVSLLVILAALHLDDSTARHLAPMSLETIQRNPRVMIAGTITLVLDVLLLIVAYEATFRLFRSSLFLRIYTATAMVLIVDTVVFTTGAFLGVRPVGLILIAALIGKLVTALIYTALSVVYLNLSKRPEDGGPAPAELRDAFHLLSYKQRFELVSEHAQRDGLTGVFNRGFFDESLSLEVLRAHRLQQTVSLLLIDLDDFKDINDRCGHPEGDKVLKCYACQMTNRLRATDIACRYGGDEFAIILPNTPLDEARKVGRSIKDRCREECNVPDGKPRVSASATIGVSAFPDDGGSVEELVQAADKRLYDGKRAGGDCVV